MTEMAAAGIHGDERNMDRASIALELAAVLSLFALSLAAFPLTRIMEGGVVAQLYPFVRMGAFLLLVTWLLRRRGQSWRDLGLKLPRWAPAILAVVLGYVAVVAMMVLVVVPTIRALGISYGTPPALAYLEGNGAALAYWLAVSWLAAAFGEELLARGWLLNGIERLMGSHRTLAVATAVIGQALLFGVGHAWNGVGGMIVASAVGLVLGLAYLVGGRNLWPVILVHGLLDSQSFLAIYAGVAPGPA